MDTQTRSPSVSPLAYRVLTKLRRDRRSHLSLPEDAGYLREFTANPTKLIDQMVRSGALLPVSRGRYTVAPVGVTSLRQAAPIELLVHARLSPLTPYFISYFSGLVEHALTDLESDAIYVAVRKRGVSVTTIAGALVATTQIASERKWFGEERVSVERSGYYLRGRLERVLLDTLDRPKLCGGAEIIGRAWERAFREERVDEPWLIEHAPALGHSVTRRAAFWLDRLGRGDLAESLTPHLGDLGVATELDSSESYGARDWPVDSVWGVRVNIPEDLIYGWLAYGK